MCEQGCAPGGSRPPHLPHPRASPEWPGRSCGGSSHPAEMPGVTDHSLGGGGASRAHVLGVNRPTRSHGDPGSHRPRSPAGWGGGHTGTPCGSGLPRRPARLPGRESWGDRGELSDRPPSASRPATRAKQARVGRRHCLGPRQEPVGERARPHPVEVGDRMESDPRHARKARPGLSAAARWPKEQDRLHPNSCARWRPPADGPRPPAVCHLISLSKPSLPCGHCHPHFCK